MWKRVNPDGKGEEMLAVDGVITANDRNRITVEVCDKRRPENYNIKTPKTSRTSSRPSSTLFTGKKVIAGIFFRFGKNIILSLNHNTW